jgi:hypothetical protein
MTQIVPALGLLEVNLKRNDLAYYFPIMVSIFWNTDLLGKNFWDHAWSKEDIINVLSKALTDDIPDHLKEEIRPWAEGRRPDLEQKRAWARSWHDTNMATVHGYPTRISEGNNSKGQRTKRFFFGELRVDESTYLSLTCEAIGCPIHQETMERFQQRVRGEKTIKKKDIKLMLSNNLSDEIEIDWKGGKVIARKGLINKVFACRAHGPVTGNVVAFDLYDLKGVFVETIYDLKY